MSQIGNLELSIGLIQKGAEIKTNGLEQLNAIS